MAKTLKHGEKIEASAATSPWHLQGSQLVAIDCETTGLDPAIHEIFQMAIIPLDYRYLPREDVRPFTMSMRIESPEVINYAELGSIGISRKKLELHTTHGIDQMSGVDKLCEWVERLNLPPNRRLVPLSVNWPHDRQFLISWMGRELFELTFHPHYRDLIPAVQLINDIHYQKGGEVYYRQCSLSILCRMFKIERSAAHDALNDAAATAEIYRRMLNKYAIGFNEN